MRDELNLVLKEFLQGKLKEVKAEKHLTQEEVAFILQMERRTFAGVMSGEYSLGGLSMALFMAFLVEDANHEIDVLREKFLEVLGEDWKNQVMDILK